ncbi:MAG: hypothetical protein PCFJNLEI_02331 [Verrucomicrobiae bacterium]|nr:hypothetical protein [Verrucomicrobiae bacterium]
MGSTPVTVPTAAQLETKLNAVFGKQANVFFSVWNEIAMDFPYDFDLPNDKLDTMTTPCDQNTSSDEWQNLYSGTITNADLQVFHVKALANICSTIQPGGWTPKGNAPNTFLPVSFVQDDHPGGAAYIDTHEIGHALGFLKDLETAALGDNTRLMWHSAQEGDPCRLVRDEWRKFNRRARGEP